MIEVDLHRPLLASIYTACKTGWKRGEEAFGWSCFEYRWLVVFMQLVPGTSWSILGWTGSDLTFLSFWLRRWAQSFGCSNNSMPFPSGDLKVSCDRLESKEYSGVKVRKMDEWALDMGMMSKSMSK